jgi:uncharacterized RDD family membrane protein YckC
MCLPVEPKPDERNKSKVPLSGKQLLAGILVAAGLFGYLTVATIFHANPMVRLIMIGPYGISAAIWCALTLGILGWLAGRERRDQNR